MSKCEQCIVREFSSLKPLQRGINKTGGLQDFTNYKKKVIFEEGENVNGIFA
jgi:hypothetical protein